MTLLAVAVLIIVVAIVAVKLLARTETAGTRSAATQLKFDRIHAALIGFVSANGRLPCPANPLLDVGFADPPGQAVTCNLPGVGGTVPWATLGMNRDDALDSWGWKISYHVFSGGVGSLTQTDGASMVKCECDYNAAGAVCEVAQTLPTAGLCSTSVDPFTYGTTEALFLQGKGLPVNDFGTNHTDAAYVLISHGPSGLRAYTATGARRTDLVIANAAELANTTDAGPFVARAPSSGLSPDDANFFDDLISYVALPDLLRRAGQGGRDWPESAPPARVVMGYTMDSATVSAAMGGGSVSPGSLGDNRVDFGSGSNRARVQGFDSGGNQDISFNTSGGAPSLGISGNTSNLITSFGGERLRIDFARSGSKFGVAMADLGTYDVSGTTFTERVQFRFSGGASTVTIIKSGCKPDGGLATFSIDPATDFDRVEITPLFATPSLFAPTATSLADFKLCDATAAACVSSLATQANSCA